MICIALRKQCADAVANVKSLPLAAPIPNQQLLRDDCSAIGGT
jgi:hypothetical protein